MENLTLENNKLDSKIKKRSFFIQLICESKLFIVFSFFSCLLPIIYCLISAEIKPNGSQAVMAVGYVSPFLLAFMQIAFSMSMIIFYQVKKEIKGSKSEYTIFSSSLWLSLFLGIIMAFFYLFSSYLYIFFSNNKPNTQATLQYGIDFIWTTIPFILLIPVITTLFFYIYHKNKIRSLILVFIFFSSIFLLSYLFGIILNFKVLGIGIGTSISALLIVLLAFFTIKLLDSLIIYFPYQIRNLNILVSKFVLKESLTNISLSVFKGVAIVFLAFTIPLTINNFVPLSYQMSRVLWFNAMYFIPFLGIGIGETIRAHYLTHTEDKTCDWNHSLKKDLIIVGTTLILTILISIGCIFLIFPLTKIYVKNDFNEFQNNKFPEISGWGKPIASPNDIIQLDELKNIELTEFPTLDKLTPLKPLTGNPIEDKIIKAQNAIIAIENLNKIQNNLEKINEWTQIQLQNNPDEVKHIIENISDWIKWLNQTNEEGITLLNFLETKYNLTGSFKNILDSLIAKNENWKEEIVKFKPLFKDATSYFVYVWLYKKTDPIVTESFINLRPLLNYNDLINKYTINGKLDIKNLLLDNKIIDIFPSLFLHIQTFNAKSMIYISMFASLNSVWAILLQINVRNYKKGMPYWFMILVYFLCISGLVTFGVLFGVEFTNTLGKNNPFQYLDAWTFPLVLISFFAICVVSVKWIKSYKFIKK